MSADSSAGVHGAAAAQSDGVTASPTSSLGLLDTSDLDNVLISQTTLDMAGHNRTSD